MLGDLLRMLFQSDCWDTFDPDCCAEHDHAHEQIEETQFHGFVFLYDHSSHKVKACKSKDSHERSDAENAWPNSCQEDRAQHQTAAKYKVQNSHRCALRLFVDDCGHQKEASKSKNCHKCKRCNRVI